MAEVWTLMSASSTATDRANLTCFSRRYGTPSKVNVESRLFVYLPLVAQLYDLPLKPPEPPEISSADVRRWIARAERERFELPDWIFDRHTTRGRRMGRGYAHFFDEAAKLANPSKVLGEDMEKKARSAARKIYLDEEQRYGRAGTGSRRKRWRERAAMSQKVSV